MSHAPLEDSFGQPVHLTGEPVTKPVRTSVERFRGRVVALRSDDVDLGGGEVVTRDVLEHPGAVGVIALDDDERVLMVRQYRHPVASMLWEPPAGLLDVAGEDPLDAVKRELYEEAGYRADRWQVLVDVYNSPGSTDEAIRLYLARGLTPVEESEKHVGTGEERDMPFAWIPLDQAVRGVLEGQLHNPSAVAGVLAAAVAKADHWTSLRPPDAPWERRTSKSTG